ncbi:MAG: hypothetical protein RL398_1178 [Planctomycetota bacterium]|jgi:hypothetical protein
MNPAPRIDWRTGVAAFVPSLVLYLGTASAGLQLDDAAELTLCAREWSAAHPPGYPLWTALAHLWGSLLGFSPWSMAAWSAVCGAAAAAVWAAAADVCLQRLAPQSTRGVRLVAAVGAALVVALGAAVWAWANTVEVYALQGLAGALVALGVGLGVDGQSRLAPGSLVAGVGLGLGLANHHLAMVVVVPWLPWLVAAANGDGLRRSLAALRSLILPALGVVVVAYGMLVLRAHAEVGYSFGEPATLSRLWHHLRGGFYGDLVMAEGVDYGGRVAVYAEVCLRALWLGWLPAGLGAVALWRSKRGLLAVVYGVPLLLIALQLTRAYVPNMDATVAPGLQWLTLPVALGWSLGMARLGSWGVPAVLGVLAVSLAANWTACDRRGYAPGDDVLARLDASLPPRAILLASSWETQTLPLLARDERGWRPDVDVLAGSIKGPNAPLLARRWPDLHAALRDDYERYLAAIAAVHPDFVHTDFFAFESQATWSAYAALVQRLFAVARQAQRPVLLDKATMTLLLEAKTLTQAQVHACGALFSVGEVQPALPFPAPGSWLTHPMLRHDLCAYGTLFDLQAMAPQIAGYWRARGRGELALAAEQAATALAAAWASYRPGVPEPRRRVKR